MKPQKDPYEKYRTRCGTPDYVKLYDNPAFYEHSDDPKAVKQYRDTIRQLGNIKSSTKSEQTQPETISPSKPKTTNWFGTDPPAKTTGG